MNNELGLIIQNEKVVVSSRTVAEVYEKEHKSVLRDIRNILEIIPEAKHNFVPGNYKDKNNQDRPEFVMDRQGFSMLVMGFTGEKAKQFTYKYTLAFENMANQISKNKPSCIEDVLIQSLQEMKNMKLQIQQAKEETAAVKEQVTEIKEVIINREEDWRKEVGRKLRKIGLKHGDYKKYVDESYKILQERSRCNLNQRLENLKARMALSGATKTSIEKTNFLDVIQLDRNIKEIYINIVNQLYIKHAA